MRYTPWNYHCAPSLSASGKAARDFSEMDGIMGEPMILPAILSSISK